MKKKKKHGLPQRSPEAEIQRSEEELQGTEFTLEEIMREFGGSAPSSPPADSASQAPAFLDPALQSPIPRHRTVDTDPETQRHTGSAEELPERHIPEPGTDSGPQVPSRKSRNAAPPEQPAQVPPPPAAPVAPPEEDRPIQSPHHSPAPLPEPEIRTGHSSRMGKPAAPPRRKKPAKAAGRAPDSVPESPPSEPASRSLRTSTVPSDATPVYKPDPSGETGTAAEPSRPVWINSASRRRPAPEDRQPPSPEPSPPKKHTPPPQHSPVRKEAPVKGPPPVIPPETQYRQAERRRKNRTIRLGVALVFTLGALALGLCRAQGYLDSFQNQRLLTAGELGLLLICAALTYDVFLAGAGRLLQPGFSLNTLIALNIVVCLADGVLSLETSRITYCPLACLLLCSGLWGLALRDRATCSAMDAARKTSGDRALVREPNVFQKYAGALRGSGNLQEFLQANRQAAGPERILDGYALAVLLISAGVAGLTCRGSAADFFQYWAATLLAGTPLAGPIAWARPWAILSRRLQSWGAALYGWPGACRLSGKLAVPISDQDLFPGENVKMNGVKYFGGHTPDQVVAYGAAVISAAGSGLTDIFNEQLEIRGARRYNVSKLRRYEVGGVGAEIGPDSVLVGSLRFMQSMGVDMPAGTRVSQAVYVAINGTLAGVFAVHYGVNRAVAESLGSLTACRGVLPVITAGDFIITESFLRTKFRVNTTKLKIPPLTVRSELAKREATEAAAPCALLRDDRFGAAALAVAGARALQVAVRWGVFFDLLSGVLGMGIMAILADLAAGGIMSLVNLTLFLLLWAVPGLLLSSWPRNI